MRIIAIGDIHGRTCWKKIIEKESKADKIIFIGDYFDSFDYSPKQQKDNFKEILELKKANLDKVVLLIGNHDFHYLSGVNEEYSGYQPYQHHDINEMLENALKDDLMQMAFEYENYLFSHAGIGKDWYVKNWFDNDDSDAPNYYSFAETVNYLFKKNRNIFKFTIGRKFSNTGDDECQTPIWIRPNSLINVSDNSIQVVGHTQQYKIKFDSDLILIDALHSGEYLIIENGKTEIGKWKI